MTVGVGLHEVLDGQRHVGEVRTVGQQPSSAPFAPGQHPESGQQQRDCRPDPDRLGVQVALRSKEVAVDMRHSKLPASDRHQVDASLAGGGIRRVG